MNWIVLSDCTDAKLNWIVLSVYTGAKLNWIVLSDSTGAWIRPSQIELNCIKWLYRCMNKTFSNWIELY